MINYISNEKHKIIDLIVGLINVNVKVDLSYYATKADIKNILYVDTSSFALKPNLTGLKPEMEKSYIGKLVPGPANLSKLSDVVKNVVVKKAVYEKVNTIHANRFILKTKYDTDKSELQKKISDTRGTQ